MKAPKSGCIDRIATCKTVAALDKLCAEFNGFRHASSSTINRFNRRQAQRRAELKK